MMGSWWRLQSTSSSGSRLYAAVQLQKAAYSQPPQVSWFKTSLTSLTWRPPYHVTFGNPHSTLFCSASIPSLLGSVGEGFLS